MIQLGFEKKPIASDSSSLTVECGECAWRKDIGYRLKERAVSSKRACPRETLLRT